MGGCCSIILNGGVNSQCIDLRAGSAQLYSNKEADSETLEDQSDGISFRTISSSSCESDSDTIIQPLPEVNKKSFKSTTHK